MVQTRSHFTAVFRLPQSVITCRDNCCVSYEPIHKVRQSWQSSSLAQSSLQSKSALSHKEWMNLNFEILNYHLDISRPHQSNHTAFSMEGKQSNAAAFASTTITSDDASAADQSVEAFATHESSRKRGGMINSHSHPRYVMNCWKNHFPSSIPKRAWPRNSLQKNLSHCKMDWES